MSTSCVVKKGHVDSSAVGLEILTERYVGSFVALQPRSSQLMCPVLCFSNSLSLFNRSSSHSPNLASAFVCILTKLDNTFVYRSLTFALSLSLMCLAMTNMHLAHYTLSLFYKLLKSSFGVHSLFLCPYITNLDHL